MAVDDLFDGGPTPVVDPIPRLRYWLYWAGVLVFGGFCCFSGPFGAFASIVAWARAGDEIERAQAGLGPPGTEARARSLRNQAFGLMIVSLLSLTVQCMGYGFLAASGDAIVAVQAWIQEVLNAVLPEEGLTVPVGIAAALITMVLISAVFGVVNRGLRWLSQRAVFGTAGAPLQRPRKPLPPVPHDLMQAYIDKELTLRAEFPELVVVHPELGTTDDDQRYTVGEWAFCVSEASILPDGLTFLAVVVPGAGGPAAVGPTEGGPTEGGPAAVGPAEGGPAAGGPAGGPPEVLWREARAVLALLGPRVRRGQRPCVHLRVDVSASERAGLLEAIRKLPERKG